jgi:hypothetical protein
MPTGKMVDRRVTRTKKALLDALHSLISEKDYDSIIGPNPVKLPYK